MNYKMKLIGTTQLAYASSAKTKFSDFIEKLQFGTFKQYKKDS